MGLSDRAAHCQSAARPIDISIEIWMQLERIVALRIDPSSTLGYE